MKLEFRSCEIRPLHVSFKFVRGTRHTFDYVNPLQTVLDLMVEVGVLDDDNADQIIPVFEPYEYDKDNPGVWITLLELILNHGD